MWSFTFLVLFTTANAQSNFFFPETPQLHNSVSAKTLLYMGANTEFLALDAPS